jgi:hypothetical protein
MMKRNLPPDVVLLQDLRVGSVRKDSPLLFVLAVMCCFLAVPVRAQQQLAPEDPENEKEIGLWLDQGVSTSLSANKSLEIEFHERFDEGISSLFEYFVQGGIAFRLRPWFTLIPIYRYQRYPGNPNIIYENRLQLNLTLSTSRGPWRPSLRTLVEGRFPDNRPASARLRFRPGIEYTLPLHMARQPVLVVNNEFFIVPWNNPFANGDSSYTQNRFQVGVRLPISDSVSVRPYYLSQSVNLPTGWDTNEVFGISLAFKVQRKTRRSIADNGYERSNSSRAGGYDFPKKCSAPQVYDCFAVKQREEDFQ